MKRTECVYAVLVCMVWSVGFTGTMTDIFYEITDLGAGRWEYTYEVANLSLSVDGSPAAIEEFTVWFDSDLYDNLAVTTTNLLLSDWDQIVWQPEPILQDPGAYDAITISSNMGIGIGQSVYGFSVSFNWLGQSTPGSQHYEIVNPDTFAPIESGFTVPEPVTLVLLALGGMGLHKKEEK